MKRWMYALVGVLGLGLSLAHAAPPQTDGLGVLPGLRQVDMVRLQRKFVSGANLTKWLSPAQQSVMQRFGDKPDGAEQYAHEVLLGLPDLTEPQRTALQALAGSDNPDVHKRFWRLAYLVLTPRQCRQLTPLLPTALRHGPNPTNYFDLPGITAAQAHRVKSRFTEIEATMEPVQSQIKQLQARASAAKDYKPPKLQDQMLALQEDATSGLTAAEDDVNSALTPAQRDALLELPPLTDRPELLDTLGDLMDGLTLTPAQAQHMQALIPGLQALQADAESKAKRLIGAHEAGSDEMLTMASVRSVQEPILQAQLDMARQLVPMLSPEQRAAWMHAPPKEHK